MGRNNNHDYGKNRRKKHRKRDRRVIIQSSLLKKSWNTRLSVRANFDRIGLAFDPNEAVRKTGRMKEVDVLTDSNVVDLKNIKKLKKRREKFISEDDRMFCMYLLELYGEDYGAMCRDPRNVYQLTLTQIERLISAFRRSRHYLQYLKDKSDNNLHVLELYE
ncbi:Nucleolar protein 16 [Taenia solium]